jgi:hypothetical protein
VGALAISFKVLSLHLSIMMVRVMLSLIAAVMIIVYLKIPKDHS